MIFKGTDKDAYKKASRGKTPKKRSKLYQREKAKNERRRERKERSQFSMLRQLKNNYPTTKIVCGTLLIGYKKDEKERYIRADARYNDVIRLVAKEEGCLLADIAQSGECYETLDYCHPTKKGHKQIAKLWLAALKTLLTE